MLTIYTDGAYSSARDRGGVGIVIISGDKKITFSKAYNKTTNNRMEMRAVILALNMIKKPVDKIEIISDSMYVIGCATLGWKRKKNQDLWKVYDKAFNNASQFCSNITFKHVKGHNGDEMNELCDKLAVDATQLYE